MSDLSFLVVDDDKVSCKILKFILEAYFKAHVDFAHNPMFALSLVENNDYSLVISDFVMEPIDGINLYKQVRAIKDTPFLLMSASAEIAREYADKAFNIQTIAKPISKEELVAKVKNILGFAV